MSSLSRTVTTIGVIALTATIAAAFLAHGSLCKVEASSTAVPNSRMEQSASALLLPAGSTLTRLVTTADEMIGAKVYVGDGLVTLKDLTWGVDADNRVHLALVVFETADGHVQTMSSPTVFPWLTRRVEDLGGCLFGFEGRTEDVRVRVIEYAVDGEGRLVVGYLDCEDSDGRRQVVDNLLGFPCCHQGTVLICSGACVVPTSCGGTPPNCTCSGGSACGSRLIGGCRGGCPGTEPTCTGTACTNDFLDCHCN
jgi:hypothetical protein